MDFQESVHSHSPDRC